ncbi:MAG: acyl-ACP--UDP-N-acetylglucosamine O-acyltransferase [Alphaproteobacteria bacterium]|nr:acyl-ACP--UDP-N-acetylglucosamine O-acyltransferase [Alphaproteobacteria bacterium]
MTFSQVTDFSKNTSVNIHPTAIVDPQAQLGERVSIGAYSIIGPHVVLGDDVEVLHHVVIVGRTNIGARTKIYPFAAIGFETPDKKYKGEPSTLIIGTDNIIREHATLHPGTEGGGMVTRVGNNCLLMIACHVAHDCTIGNNVIMSNNATLGGHVIVGDYANIGGLAAVLQFVRIGHHAMIAGLAGVGYDVIPYGTVIGERGHLNGLNLIGLRRRGFDRELIHSLRNAYRLIFAKEGSWDERVSDAAETFKGNALVMEIINFVMEPSKRPICKPKGLEEEESDV